MTGHDSPGLSPHGRRNESLVKCEGGLVGSRWTVPRNSGLPAFPAKATTPLQPTWCLSPTIRQNGECHYIRGTLYSSAASAMSGSPYRQVRKFHPHMYIHRNSTARQRGPWLSTAVCRFLMSAWLAFSVREFVRSARQQPLHGVQNLTKTSKVECGRGIF